MLARVQPVKNRPDWFVVIVEHRAGIFHWRWQLDAESPYKTDCDVRAAAFNRSLAEDQELVAARASDIYRPALSMCENAYAGKTEPRKL